MQRIESEHLQFSEENPGCGYHDGEPYSGQVVRELEDRQVELTTYEEGFENGQVLIWEPGGKLVCQGIRRHKHGRVGSWQGWDEEGRLLWEKIYDALGNLILHRELDGSLNIVKQERFEPVTFMADPETGEQRPAPWL
ncbi:hypothetical protein [Nocardiopsis sp. L17-MgMaSL7]|uniref:hypothetical protein n=1 Tax=Nocardiopsis sp. L17-MgMaSL7 TaxID=1938893 RepID=UPI0018F722FD|nr:hypothetical protein [Nocardiopsis sp. L17-MgMaSL7]